MFRGSHSNIALVSLGICNIPQERYPQILPCLPSLGQGSHKGCLLNHADSLDKYS